MSRGLPAFVVGAWIAFLLSFGALAREGEAKGSKAEPKGGGAPVPLKGASISDRPTAVSVPLGAELCVVVGLPEHFWVQCPRHLPVPTTLAGDGTIVQYMNPRGGSVSMLYVGAVPLHPALEGEALEARAARTALDFAVGLPQAYARVDWTVTSVPVRLSAAEVKVDGKKTPAWRSARYASHPAGGYGGPRSEFSGECVLFAVPAAERLVYVALDAKDGGTTLDRALERLSVKPLRAANPTGRRVQLNDLAESQAAPGRYPVRLIAYDGPAGFQLTPALLALEGEWVFAEDRVDAEGRTTGRLRFRQQAADPARSQAGDLEAERSLWSEGERGAVEEVDLAVRGHKALLFSRPAPADGPSARAHTAVLRLDDLLLTIDWVTLGDAALVSRDHDAFAAMLRSLELAVRW